jgi:hypothetical protein
VNFDYFSNFVWENTWKNVFTNVKCVLKAKIVIFAKSNSSKINIDYMGKKW